MSQLELLIGDKRRLIVELAASLSLLSGFTEGAILAIVAQVATKIVNGKGGSARAGLLHIGASIDTLLWIALGAGAVPAGAAVADLGAAGEDRRRRPAAPAHAYLPRLQQRLLGRAVARPRGPAAGDHDQPDQPGDRRRAAGHQPRELLADLRDPDGLRDRAQPDGGGGDVHGRDRPVRAAAPDADAGRQAQPRTLPRAGALRGCDRRGQPPGRGVPGVRRHRPAVPPDARLRAGLPQPLLPHAGDRQSGPQHLPEPDLRAARGRADGAQRRRAHHAGRLLAIVLLLLRAAQNAQSIQGSYQALQQSLPFLDRLRRAEDALPRQRATVQGTRPLPEISTLAFEEVSFAYTPGRPVLSEVSFSVEAGEAIGIVGPSGAGKSTLVQILLQLRDPLAGRYLINGVDVRDYSPRGLAPARGLRAPGTPAAARHRGRQHPLLPRRRRRGRRARRAPGPHPRRHHQLGEGLRDDRRPARGRRLGRPAAAHLPGAGARGAPPGARARRAHQRAGPPLGGADPGIPDRSEERADAVHGRPPHVHAGHVRPGDGDPRRAPDRVRHAHRPCRSTTTTTGPPR